MSKSKPIKWQYTSPGPYDVPFSSKLPSTLEASDHSKLLLRLRNETARGFVGRLDKLYLTIALPDAKDISVKCEPQGSFSFSALGLKGEPFNFSLKLYGNISPQGCKTKVGLRNIICAILKEEKVWWKRLLKSEEKPAPYIKVDWNKWCDEDDEEAGGSDLASDDDDVYTGGDGESSDDEGMLYLPDLEKAREKYM